MKKFKKQAIGIFIIAVIMIVSTVVQSCHSQRRLHKAVPCPCEKKKR
jgi:hypothetical protein